MTCYKKAYTGNSEYCYESDQDNIMRETPGIKFFHVGYVPIRLICVFMLTVYYIRIIS